ncbi:MAG: leucine-rich repeat protein, partial [Clostridia bacterium]|nr:leucine-rich repeat protein [Clostridia bacterium]
VEVRLAEGSACNEFSSAGYVTRYMDATTILFDARINSLNIKGYGGEVGLFMNNKALTTFDHVTFKEDGSYDEDVATGVVDLSGFANVTPFVSTSSGAIYPVIDLLNGSSAIENVIWFNSISAGTYGEMAGVVDFRALANASSLKTLTLTSPLTSIGQQAFQNCGNLVTLDLKGGIEEDATIASNAFTGVTQDVTVRVYSAADEARATALFASLSNFEVVLVDTTATPDEVKGVITADAFNIRTNGTAGPAIRALFTLNHEKLEVAEAADYVLSDYGVLVFSANILDRDYNNDIDAIIAAALAGGNNALKKVSVKEKGIYVNGKELNAGTTKDKIFCAAITGIPEDNYVSEVYTYAYAVWSDKDGTNTWTTTVTYENDMGKSAYSLYDLTLSAFKQGVVNSGNMDEDKLWPVLSKGAFSITNGEQKAFASGITPTVAYEFDAENKFTYLDLPLYAWKFYQYNETATPDWDAYAYDLEEKSSTNVVWSILRDGDNLVVVYRRADGIADDVVATLPAIRDRGGNSTTNYGGHAPYSSSYFTSKTVVEGALEYGNAATNGLYKKATIHSPILSNANAGKITTLVIDYGVNKISDNGSGALENITITSLKTIVYPEGITVEKRFLNNNHYVQNVICASENKDYYADVDAAIAADSSFGAVADLSGLSGFKLSYAFADARYVENVILPESIEDSGLEQPFFQAIRIKRVWTVGAKVPADGTVDLTGANKLTSLQDRCFTLMSMYAVNTKPTIILPASFLGVTEWAYSLVDNPSRRTGVFGNDMSFTVKLNDIKALTTSGNVYGDRSLMEFYDNMQKNASANDKNDFDKLTFVCKVNGEEMSKTIAEWRTYLVAQGLYTPAE